MGWGHGINAEGREVGYTVEAICDQEGCSKEIDRGLYYVCGGMHDGGEDGCGRYFCSDHLGYAINDADEMSSQLCSECQGSWEKVTA
jgi:hypothetical protein